MHEPVRCADIVAIVGRCSPFDDSLAHRVNDTDEFVVATVEKGTDSQFDRYVVRVILAQRKGERRGIVGILDRQL